MKQFLKITTILLIMAYSASTLSAQEYNNVVSIGLPGLLVGNVNLGYEKVLSDNSSLSFHAGLFIPREVPSFLVFGDEESQEIIEEFDNSVGGFSLVGEYRFYMGNKGAPYGFYAAPMFKFSNYALTVGADYDGESAEVKASLNRLGLGIQLGKQFKLGERMTLDWYFLGLSIDRNTVSIEATSNDPDTDFQKIATDLQTDIDDLPLYSEDIEITSGDDFVKATASILGLGLRSGLTLGYRF